MKRGTANEEAVLQQFRTFDYVVCAMQTGLFGPKDCNGVAASPDAICLIDVQNFPELECATTPIFALMKIKTAVSHTSLQPDETVDEHCVELGSLPCNELVPIDHQMQMLHQAACCSISELIYIIASESQIRFDFFYSWTPRVGINGTGFPPH